ncbi:MAG: CARDB domain-containing protein [Candidatus Paceibacterota bacterium]
MSDTTSKSFIGKILFVLGVIIILIILASLIIKFVPRIFSGLANVGSSIQNVVSKDEISVTASDVSLTNGERFVVSWDSNIDEAGAYSISYSCVDNVEVDIETASGVRRLICDNPFTLGANPGSVTLVSTLNKANAFVDVPINVSFSQGNTAPLASNSVVVTIQNGDINAGTFGENGTTISAEPVEQIETPRPTTTTSQPRSVVYTPVVTGPADLSISSIAPIGNNRIAFTVSNNGGRSTGNWTFNYNTPTSPKETLSSPLQPSLGPNQSILYTLTFNAKASGNQNVVVQLDPTNIISEASETNNIGTITLTGAAYGGGSSNNSDNSYNSRDDADFVISNLEVGRLSGNNFIEDDEAEDGDDVAIRFIVKNKGGDETEDWRFEVRNLPYDNGNTFRSKEYNSLEPGESIEITVEFENIDEGDYDIRVEVDSDDDTDEESESNNDDSVDLEVER